MFILDYNIINSICMTNNCIIYIIGKYLLIFYHFITFIKKQSLPLTIPQNRNPASQTLSKLYFSNITNNRIRLIRVVKRKYRTFVVIYKRTIKTYSYEKNKQFNST